MSSLDIAELTGKLHRNVLADIRTMLFALGLDVLTFQQIYVDSMNRQQSQYLLPKRLVFNLVTGYSIPLRQKVIDRWMELEEAERSRPMVVLPDFSDPAAAARAWAAEYEAKTEAAAAPKAALGDPIAPNFRSIVIPVRVGFRIRKDRAFEMDRDGLTLLAMGLAGEKALRSKQNKRDPPIASLSFRASTSTISHLYLWVIWMFDGIKRHLAEKQADRTLRMVKEGIDSLSQLPPPHQHFAKSGLVHSHDGLVGRLGPLEGWDRKTRTAVMSQLLTVVSEAQRAMPRNVGEEAALAGSFGAQMLVFYYDSIDMSGHKAEEIRQIIEDWFDFRP